MPAVTQRIRQVVDADYNGSVRAFCLALGFAESQKVNRLFKTDARNGKYPTPSIDILSEISNKLGISLLWLQSGEGPMLKTETVNGGSGGGTSPQIADVDVVRIPADVWQVIKDQAASLQSKDSQVDRLITQIEHLNTSLSAISAGFQAVKGSKIPPPQLRDIELK